MVGGINAQQEKAYFDEPQQYEASPDKGGLVCYAANGEESYEDDEPLH